MKNKWVRAIRFVGLTVLMIAASGCDLFKKKTPAVYIAGFTYRVPCYWVDDARVDLTPVGGSTNSTATGIWVADGDIYVAGWYELGGSQNPGYWKNGTGAALPVLDSDKGGETDKILVDGKDVYISGSVNTTYSGSLLVAPCYWKNGVRTDLPVLDSHKYGEARGIFVAGGNVYQAGYSTNASGVHVPCYWKNGTRFDLPVLSSPKSSEAWDIFVLDADVYVVGSSNNGSVALPCYWLNGSLNTLSSSDLSRGGRANRIKVVDEASPVVYIAGYVSTSSGAMPCWWMNGSRTDLSPSNAGYEAYGFGIDVYEADIYVCGEQIEKFMGPSKPSYWKNSLLFDLPMPAGCDYGSANDIFIYEE